MVARLQQLATFALFTFAVLGAGLLAAQGQLLLAVTASAFFASGHAIILAIEFALLTHANRQDASPPARAGQLLRAWSHETLIAPLVFCWQQPFRSHAQPNHLPPGGQGQVGVVFVHGYVCNRGLWNPWLKRLRDLGIPFVAVNLEPVFGSIDDYAPLIDKAVQQMEAATARQPLIVAHSMGGLAVRAWMSGLDADARASHVITIGTPHHGTLLARLAFTRNARQMRLDSPWLRALAARETRERNARFICFYSHCDNIAIPASTATLQGADNRHVAGVAHIELTRQEVVFREILRRVGAG